MRHDPQPSRETITVFQLCLFVLSLVMVVALLVDMFAKLPLHVSRIIQGADFVVCMILLVDFLQRFYKAPDKRAFMRWGWIDMIATIPTVDLLRLGRLVRLARIIRLTRGLRGGHRAVVLLLEHRPRSVLVSVLTSTLLLVTFSSIAILCVETAPSSNIKTAEDAVWWSVTTITTVGYGDRYPVTGEGRIIAMVLMLAGVGMFGTLSGSVASLLLGNRKQEREDREQLLARLKRIEEKLGEVPANNNAERP